MYGSRGKTGTDRAAVTVRLERGTQHFGSRLAARYIREPRAASDEREEDTLLQAGQQNLFQEKGTRSMATSIPRPD